MALITCHECDHGISDQATHCANCGAPQAASLQTPGKSVIRMGSLLGMILFGFVGFHALYLMSQGTPKGNTYIVSLLPAAVCLIVFMLYSSGPSKKTNESTPKAKEGNQ